MKLFTPRFNVGDVHATSSHLLKLTLTRLVRQDVRAQLSDLREAERGAFEQVAMYIPAIDAELFAREMARR